MLLDDDMIAFLQRPLMCIIAAVEEDGRPATGRGVGVRVADDRAAIDVIFSGWQWPLLARAVRSTGKMAATFVSPADYVTFQIKGAATLRDAGVPDLEDAALFMERATHALADLGVPRGIIAPWLTARCSRVRLR